MIHALIIDDDSNLRQGLKQMLQHLAPNIQIVGEADDVKGGVELLQKLQPQVVFLDIQLTDGTGFDILENYQSQYGKPKWQVVFITAHEQYAIRAFRFSALDFLLKPVDLEELQQVIQKIEQNAKKDLDFKNIDVLLEHISKKNETQKRIALATFEGIHLFDIKDIIRCESTDNYTTFYFVNHKAVMVSKTLKEYEELLSQHGFERIQQSHLINLQYLKTYIKKDGGYVIMTDGAELPISSRKKDRLQQIINQL